MKCALQFGAAALIVASPFAALAADQGDIFSRGNLKWDDLLTDNAAGAVTAASLLDISGDAVRSVENVRDLVVSLKGLEAKGDKATFGLSITPARTRLMRPQLSTYASSRSYRLLSATTLSYAQGDATVEGRKYDRRAVAIDSGFFLNEEDDPVIALAKMDERGGCPIFDRGEPARDAVAEAIARGELTPPASGAVPGPSAGPVTTGPQVPATAGEQEAERQRKASAACRDRVTKGLRWNRSYLSASLGTGWIKPADGGAQHSLGRTMVVGLVYGFDQVASWRERAALTLAWRHTKNEPILTTLDSASVQTKDSSLLVTRLAGGSSTIRALLEMSNAKSDGGTTASQRAFTRALGLDVRVQEGLWVGLRFGRQRKIDGNGTEVGSLLSLSYSPTSFLKE